MNNKERFEQDLAVLLSRLTSDVSKEAENKLITLKDWLVKLQKENVVKINHSVMELVCAKYLILKGYEVQIEYPVSEILTCDLYSIKGYGNLIVEVETGFIPPDHALDPLTYTSARLASKIIRYSNFAGKFALAVPPHYILAFPPALSLPPRRRTAADIKDIKKLCDLYYQNPPVSENEIQNASIHEIYIINVDRGKVLEMDPETYLKRALQKGFNREFGAEEDISPMKTAFSSIGSKKLDKTF
jgi:hypothetical protein